MVEAISVGVPVLASQSYGGINEIINEKRLGFIYQSKNQLKKKLNLIYRNKLNFKINTGSERTGAGKGQRGPSGRGGAPLGPDESRHRRAG